MEGGEALELERPVQRESRRDCMEGVRANQEVKHITRHGERRIDKNWTTSRWGPMPIHDYMGNWEKEGARSKPEILERRLPGQRVNGFLMG